MPLPPEILEKIKADLEEAEKSVKGLEDIISDLRTAGIDASKEEADLKAVKEELTKLRLFYSRQQKRLEKE